jgi:hypothetical protein
MKKINISFVLVMIIFLTSCQSVKDGLSGNKTENSDEFLVQKKNPLIVPPDYMKLPSPENNSDVDEIQAIEEETDIQKILQTNIPKKKEQIDNYGNAEEFVLKNIK